MTDQKIILIGGPTASGKSALAMRIARQRKGSIINADAMQIYAGLPLLTAQPDAADKAEIPHLLYEVTDPGEASSAGKWLGQARAAIAKTLEAGRTPIVVGGTGLYFEALRGGLADIPPIPEDVRNDAEKLYAAWGEEKFRAELAKHDPESAARIARNDRQRLIRAWEVVMHTGKCLGQWQREGSEVRGQRSGKKEERREEGGTGRGEGYIKSLLLNAEIHLILPEREILYTNCDRRFLAMIERGAIDEVKNLMARDLSPAPRSSPKQALPAMKILGVREIAGYLRGETSLNEAIAKAQQMTRNYAKRQMTWFRNRWKA